MIFSSGLEFKKLQNSVSKHLEILPKIREGGNSARILVKTASSVTIIGFLVYSVIWRGSAKCDGLYCVVACSAVVLWWAN